MVDAPQGLVGEVAIVTGGGRGLGKAMALALAEVGADLVVAARTVEQIEQTASEVRALGRRALAIPTDVTDSKAISRMVERTLGEFGKIDILVNNAGTSTDQWVLEMSEEEWRRVLDTNLTGVFACSKAVAKHMVERRKGKIINIASVHGVGAMPTLAPYCASKGGVIQLTKVMALEWARYGIRVNAIGPAYFETPLTAGILANEKIKGSIIRGTPLKRFGQPQEMGPLAVYLASPASDYVTGQTFFLDGGILSRLF